MNEGRRGFLKLTLILAVGAVIPLPEIRAEEPKDYFNVEADNYEGPCRVNVMGRGGVVLATFATPPESWKWTMAGLRLKGQLQFKSTKEVVVTGLEIMNRHGGIIAAAPINPSVINLLPGETAKINDIHLRAD